MILYLKNSILRFIRKGGNLTKPVNLEKQVKSALLQEKAEHFPALDTVNFMIVRSSGSYYISG